MRHHPIVTSLVATSLLAAWLPAQGALQPCTVSPLGQQANGAGHRPAITPDGRWIAFASDASNLVAGDGNALADVFVRDRATGSIELVSVDDAGNQANGDSWATGISDDGRFVAFLSLASNLVAGDTNGVMDAFVRDRASGTTSRVSVGSAGQQAQAFVDWVAISGDGSTIVFGTASAMVPGDTNGVHDIFARTLATGAVERVSVGAGGAQTNNNSFSPTLSADARFVAFHSQASNLVANDTNGARDIFVHDRQTGANERISVDSSGAQSNADSRYAVLSADASRVAFFSFASNLVPNDTNATGDVFVRDRSAGTTTRVSVSSTGAQGVQSFSSILTFPSISANGRYVAFYSPLDGLDGPVNGRDDAFVHDLLTATTTKLSRSSTGLEGNTTSGPLAQFGANWVLETMAIASDPPIAVFSSLANNLVPWDANAAPDVFAVDLGLRCTAAGPAVVGGAASVDLSAPGRANALFVGTFGPSVAAGVFLPQVQWLPLDDDALLQATLSAFVTDASGAGAWSVAIPPLPGLVGLELYATALQLDFTGPTLVPAIGNVVTFMIQ